MSATPAASVEHVIGTDGLFILALSSGDVRLHGVDGDVARVEDRHGNDLAAEFDVEAGAGSLAVRARKGLKIKTGPHRRSSPDLDVRVPCRATIVIQTSSGDVFGEDLAGDQRYETASGDIELARIAGSVAIEAASGDVELSATGLLRLKARTVSGDLAVRAGALGEVSANTTSGDLAITGELAPDGTHRVETVSGDAVLALAGGARIEVSTLTGDVSADVPHRSERANGRRVITLGNGRATIDVRTLSGDVHVRKVRRDAPVVEPEPDGPADPAPAAPATPHAPAAPASASAAAIAAAYDAARLTILRRLERGEIDVTEAGRRLEALDAAGVPEEAARG